MSDENQPERDEDDVSSMLSAEEALSLHLHDLIDAYESEAGESHGDTTFNLEVHIVGGFFHSLPYVDHSHGAVVLMNDLCVPPRPVVVSMTHIVQLAIDPEGKSRYFSKPEHLQEKRCDSPNHH